MAYWCDDWALALEQRRLDERQREAERKMAEKKANKGGLTPPI